MSQHSPTSTDPQKAWNVSESFKSVSFYRYFSSVCQVFLVCVSTHVVCRHDYYNKNKFLKYMTWLEECFWRAIFPKDFGMLAPQILVELESLIRVTRMSLRMT